MSKLKIIDLNKQLNKESKATVEKMESLQESVQNHLATLKRIESELIRIARAEAEEKRLQQQKEADEATRREAEEAAKLAAEKQAAEQKVAPTPVKEAEDKKAAAPSKQETDNKPVAQQEPVVKQTETPPQQNTSVRPKQQGATQRPQGGAQRPQGGAQRPQGGAQRPQGGAQRPQGGAQRPQGGAQRPQGGAQRPQGGAQRPQGGAQRPARPADKANVNSQAARPKPKKTFESQPSGFVHVDKKGGQGKRYGSNYNSNDRNRKSKKTLLKEQGAFDVEGRYRSRKRSKSKQNSTPFVPIVIEKAVMTQEMISVKSLAEKTGKPVAELLKKLLLLGMMCTINSELDYDTAQLICSEFGITIELKLEKTAEDVLDEGHQDDNEKDLETRPPIVTVMGHVDHGKTSLLDAIRETRVTEHEAGGITQHIGAYTIKHKESDMTFLDTPGHEAFTAMRARGAQVTDIAILVVAADDGVMPQTIEAINHAKAAEVPIIVAINKIDKPGANPEKIKQSLTEHGLVAEEWGGDTVMVPVSAITKEGIDHLLEMIILVAEVQELKANPNRFARGTIVEAKLDKGRGPVATVLVQNGTLHVADMIVAGTAYGKVRAMSDDMGNRVDVALPSQPVEVVGFSEVPIAGDILHAVEQNSLTRQVAEERKDKQKADMLKNLSKVSLDDLFSQVAEGNLQDLNIVIKADVQGSVEAVKQALEKLANKEVRVKVIHAGVRRDQSDGRYVGFRVKRHYHWI